MGEQVSSPYYPGNQGVQAGQERANQPDDFKQGDQVIQPCRGMGAFFFIFSRHVVLIRFLCYGVGVGSRHTVPHPPGQPASRPQARTPLEQAGGVHISTGGGRGLGVSLGVGLGVGLLMGNNPRSI